MSFPFFDLEGGLLSQNNLLFLAGASGGGVEHTIINNPATFTTDLAKPLRRLVIPFTSESGLTGMNIYRTGKNMFHINGADMVASGWNRYFPNPITKAGTYRVSCQKRFGGADQKGAILGFKNSPSNTAERIGDTIGTYAFGNSSYSFSATITEEQAKAAYIYFGCSSDNAPASTFIEAEIQFELGSSSATAYEPYNGTIIPVSWQTEAGAVNEGELDALTGVLTVTSPESKTVQLDPVTLSTLIGENVLWTDTNGDNTIVYLKKT